MMGGVLRDGRNPVKSAWVTDFTSVDLAFISMPFLDHVITRAVHKLCLQKTGLKKINIHHKVLLHFTTQEYKQLVPFPYGCHWCLRNEINYNKDVIYRTIWCCGIHFITWKRIPKYRMWLSGGGIKRNCFTHGVLISRL